MKTCLVVRHNYERTLYPFMYHNIEMLQPDEVFIITEQPFSNNFKKMLKICKDNSADLILALDADLYITDTKPIKKHFDKDYCDFSFIDKFRDNKCQGGLHLYSKKIIKQLWNFCLEREVKDEESLKRPEGGVVSSLFKNKNIKPLIEQSAIGYHDFYQFREDIFYKYAYRGWREMASKCRGWFDSWKDKKDKDYIVAKKGIEWAWSHSIKDFPNGLKKEDVIKDFKKLNIIEKNVKIHWDEEEINLQ